MKSSFDIKAFLRKLRILPILIVVASFGFIVRLGDSYVSLKSMSGSAYAEETKEIKKETEDKSTPPEPPAENLKSDKQSAQGEADVKIDLPSTEPDEKAPNPDVKWQDSSDIETTDSDIKQEVFDDLTKRRLEIEQKEKKLGQREALLEAAQKELDKKVKEMEGLRDELRELLKQQTADEATRIQSLVKIYSGMKPKDAARIFNTLDTDILLDVVGSMPESKAGAILALMESDRAKLLTTLLAEQKKLPEVP